MMKIFIYTISVYICSLILLLVTEQAIAAEQALVSKTASATSTVKKAPYVIETQVQGSQEQPKVIYITPWQELNTVVDIESQALTINLPTFKPVNPRVFKQKINHYYQREVPSKKHQKEAPNESTK